MRLRPGLLAAGLAIVTAVPALAAVGTTPDQQVAQQVAPGTCDAADPALCLLPFPNDRFTVPDASTPTGRRVSFSPLAMPRNRAGKPIDPTEWNRNDGFSPGSLLLTFVPGLDLQRTFGIDRPPLEVPSVVMAPDSPMVVVDAATLQRHPFFPELDHHPDTSADQRLLLLRPLVNFTEGHRYVVALRHLRAADGTQIPPGATFAQRMQSDPHTRELLATLASAGVGTDGLFLAWDFTVASEANLAGRVLHMRDTAFAALGDTDLADGVVSGKAPPVTVDSTEVLSDGTKRVRGSVTVPNFLQYPQDVTRTPGVADPTGQLTDLPPQEVPGSRLYYGTAQPGPMDLPQQNPVAPTLTADFVCSIPPTASPDNPATPMLYGHGLLGSKDESTGGSTAQMRSRNYLPCAVDWIGMSEEDIANVATVLTDMSNFPSLADRCQQGFLDFLFLGRALANPKGLAALPAFQVDGRPVFDPAALVYDGNSQGGIMGGALTALAPDLTRATLGVTGMNYSTLLNRSVDWEGSYAEIAYTAYPDKQEQQLLFALLQMLWDRAEADGYALHMTDDPLPNTPRHQVLMQVGYGDYQVANVAAEVEGRTIGAARLATDLRPGRHWSAEPMYGFQTFRGAHRGSALIYFDSGNPPPPSANVPPPNHNADPHEIPRRDPYGADQKDAFYRTGVVQDVHHGSPYWTYACPIDAQYAFTCA